MCKKASFNPKTGVYFGFSHGVNIIPGNYRKSLWGAVDLPNGPTSLQQLLEGGRKIKMQTGVPVGIGISKENDTNFTLPGMMSAYGSFIQDAGGKVTINSEGTRAFLTYMNQLYAEALTPAVTTWTSASNNEDLVAGKASYIVNPLSAYRLAQKNVPDVADDIYFTSTMAGPSLPGSFIAHPMSYVVPKSSDNLNAAQDFLLYMLANYSKSTYISELFDYPAYLTTVPQLDTADNWLAQDPFNSKPANKLEFQRTAHEWSVMYGHPGAANAAIGEINSKFVLPQMVQKAVSGELTVEQAAQWAEEQIAPIYEKWRGQGLV